MMEVAVLQRDTRNDFELVRAWTAGDESAFRLIVARYRSMVYNVAYRIVGNREDAEDATQDAFVNLALKLHRFEGRSTLKTWVYRVAANAALMVVRTGKKHRHTFSFEGGPEADSAESVDWLDRIADPRAATDSIALSAEAIDQIDRALASLPEGFRTVAVLADVEGLSNLEIARVLDLSIPAVKSRLHRARLALRRELAGYFDRPSPARPAVGTHPSNPRRRSTSELSVRTAFA